MTALAEEIDGAIEDGCELMELVAPAHVEVNDEGHAVALWCQPQMISTVRGGRPSPKAADKPEVRIPATTIIVAIGQNIDSGAFEEFGLPCKWNEIQAQPDSMTSLKSPASSPAATAAGARQPSFAPLRAAKLQRVQSTPIWAVTTKSVATWTSPPPTWQIAFPAVA